MLSQVSEGRLGAWKGWRVSPPTLGSLEQEQEQGPHVAHVELMHLLPSPALCCSSCTQPLARGNGHEWAFCRIYRAFLYYSMKDATSLIKIVC